jgi:type I restriction enzyme, S subunit
MKADRDRIGAILSLQRRRVIVEANREYREIGIRSFGRGIFHKEPISGADLGAKRVFAIRPGDLVLSNVFAWEGAIAVARETEVGMIGSHRFMTYVPTGGRIDTSWASWFFRSERGLELVRKASPGSAGRNRTLAIDRFEALEIPLPSIDEQLQQVKYLDGIAYRAISINESLERYPAAALIAMLPDLVDVALERETVGRSKVCDVADFVSDTVHPGDDRAPAESFVGLQHVESHTGRCLGSDELESVKGRKFRFRPGDVVYGYLRPYLNKVWVADRHGLCSVDQYVLRPHQDVSSELLAYCLRSREFLSAAIRLTHNLQLPRLRSGLLAFLEIRDLRPEAATSLVPELDLLRDRVVGVAARRQRQYEVSSALVPSAINEIFADLN